MLVRFLVGSMGEHGFRASDPFGNKTCFVDVETIFADKATMRFQKGSSMVRMCSRSDRWTTALLSFTLLLAATSRSIAQLEGDHGPIDPMKEPLITDRPDFTESTEAVPAGHLQLEAGYTFTFDREGTDRTRHHTAPELLFRIGLVLQRRLVMVYPVGTRAILRS